MANAKAPRERAALISALKMAAGMLGYTTCKRFGLGRTCRYKKCESEACRVIQRALVKG